MRDKVGGKLTCVERLGKAGVAWRLSRMRPRWGVFNYARRRVGYSTMLAGKGREEVEYVVVHELTHLAAHDHGPRFQALMDARLPDRRERRTKLNDAEGRGRERP